MKYMPLVFARAHLDTPTVRLEGVFSLSSPKGGEGWGEEADAMDCASRHSFLAGRGRKFRVAVARYALFALAAASSGFAAEGSDSTETNDLETIKEIHKFFLSKSEAKTESEMKPYTNSIPGASVKYSLV